MYRATRALSLTTYSSCIWDRFKHFCSLFWQRVRSHTPAYLLTAYLFAQRVSAIAHRPSSMLPNSLVYFTALTTTLARRACAILLFKIQTVLSTVQWQQHAAAAEAAEAAALRPREKSRGKIKINGDQIKGFDKQISTPTGHGGRT